MPSRAGLTYQEETIIYSWDWHRLLSADCASDHVPIMGGASMTDRHVLKKRANKFVDSKECKDWSHVPTSAWLSRL